MKKSVFKSKTFWMNLILAIAPLFPFLEPVLNEQVLVQIFAIGNIVLRMKTSQPVGLRGDKA